MWKQEAEKLRFDEGKSWSDIAAELQHHFPGIDRYTVVEKVKSYIRHTERYKANRSEETVKSSVQMNHDGSVTSDRIIEICETEELTPELIMQLHGLTPDRWEIISYKNNYWHSQVKGGKRLVMYQSKLTVKPKAYGISLEDMDKHFKLLDRKYKPLVILPSKKTGTMMAEVNIADLHFGRLCWQGDTGNNFDHKIARKIYQQIISDICNELIYKPIEYILFPIGNDLVNSDTPSKETTAGTPQDTDARWQKLTDTATEMVIAGIDMLKTIAPVKAFYVASNHDEVTTYGIVSTVNAWFKNDDRVTVDRSAISRKYFLYGNTLLGFSHGNNEKPMAGNKNRTSKLAALAPLEARTMWAQAKYCEIHAAHLHSEHAIEEINGVIVRRISSPTAVDTWTFESGYIGAVRKAQTFIYDKELGLINTINTPAKL